VDEVCPETGWDTMRGAGSLLAAGLLVAMTAACTPDATEGATSTAPRATSVTTAPTTRSQVSSRSRRFSAARCRPPSPAKPWHPAGGGTGLIEVHGTARVAELWGLVFAPVPVPVGQEVKIVWRMTGDGPLQVSVTHSDGTPARRTFGPEEHGGSTWDRPGQEWGTGFVFLKAGCWNLHLARTSGMGDVWLLAR
jgi:hypothetical protein